MYRAFLLDHLAPTGFGGVHTVPSTRAEEAGRSDSSHSDISDEQAGPVAVAVKTPQEDLHHERGKHSAECVREMVQTFARLKHTAEL